MSANRCDLSDPAYIRASFEHPERDGFRGVQRIAERMARLLLRMNYHRPCFWLHALEKRIGAIIRHGRRGGKAHKAYDHAITLMCTDAYHRLVKRYGLHLASDSLQGDGVSTVEYIFATSYWGVLRDQCRSFIYKLGNAYVYEQRREKEA